MEQQVVISGALANVSGAVTTDELLKFMADRNAEIEFYKLCGATAAAFDWRGIFRDVGAAASIAALLWLGYEKLVEPKKIDPKSNAGVYVVLGDGEEESLRFWLGKDYKDKQIFIREFTREAKRLTGTVDGRQKIKATIEETKESNCWISVK